MTGPSRVTSPSAGGEQYPTGAQLIDEVRASTGLHDFGPGAFHDGLDVLLDSVAGDAGLTPEASAGKIDVFRRRLTNRLQIEAHFGDHPELDASRIEGPTAVTGLPRTGSTALGNMLSLDGQFRPLRIWEQTQPVPPPTTAEEAFDDRRLSMLAQFASVSTEDKAKHIFDIDASSEDTEVLGLSFRAQQMTMSLYRYHQWWRDTDMRQAYAYHRRVAVLLQSRRPPNRWLFKNPHLKFHLEDYLTAYPDGSFVMTHRDPAKVVPSYANFVYSLFPPDTRVDPVRFGAHIANHLRIGMERAIAARARIGDDRFLDVHHRDLIRDPSWTLQRIYEFLELELTPKPRAAMLRWQVVNRPSAHGAHRYTAEQYGLTAGQLRSDFDFYIRRFDVDVED